MGLIDTIKARLDLYKLEKKYTNRDKRTTFHSEARYVDGEYIYDKSSTGSSRNSMSWNKQDTKRRTSVRVSEIFTDRRSKVF